MSSTWKPGSEDGGNHLLCARPLQANLGFINKLTWQIHNIKCVVGLSTRRPVNGLQELKSCIYRKYGAGLKLCADCPRCSGFQSHASFFPLNAHFLCTAANAEVTVQFSTEHGPWWQKWEGEEKNLWSIWSLASFHACAQIARVSGRWVCFIGLRSSDSFLVYLSASRRRAQTSCSDNKSSNKARCWWEAPAACTSCN